MMYTAVDKMHLNAPLSKAASDIIVIIINYITSNFLIFAHQNRSENHNAAEHITQAEADLPLQLSFCISIAAHLMQSEVCMRGHPHTYGT